LDFENTCSKAYEEKMNQNLSFREAGIAVSYIYPAKPVKQEIR